jgi:dTDP-4-dehydrorhamnose 3,5-epimerase
MFEIHNLPIHEAFVLETKVHQDSRGLFEVFWEEPMLAGQAASFCPTNAHHSYNTAAGTLRGIHYQKYPHGQAKLVSCVCGRIWDVMVDVRTDSPSFGKWHGSELQAGSGKSVYIPAGCAHGFVALENDSTLAYLIEGDYQPNAGRVLRWDDPLVGIDWPLTDPIMSDKDAAAPGWDQCEF